MTDEELVAVVRLALRSDQRVALFIDPGLADPRRTDVANNYITAERRHLELLAAIKQAADRICGYVEAVEENVNAIYNKDR